MYVLGQFAPSDPYFCSLTSSVALLPVPVSLLPVRVRVRVRLRIIIFQYLLFFYLFLFLFLFSLLFENIGLTNAEDCHVHRHIFRGFLSCATFLTLTITTSDRPTSGSIATFSDSVGIPLSQSRRLLIITEPVLSD